MPTPPTPAQVRLTISVSPEVHAAFSRLAQAGSMSLSRAMGDWLEDTVDAATYTATMMEKARAAPKMVMREVHAYALGLADETGDLMASITQKGRASAVAAEKAHAAAAAQGAAPPVGNTGGKVQKTAKSSRGGKSS